MASKIATLFKSPVRALLLFVVLSVALRFFSFFPSVLDHDESTYLEIAREMLEGKTLYVDLIDIKPPGVFLIYAGFQLIFGRPIWVMRLLAALWISLTSFMIYRTSRLFATEHPAGIAGGIIYILFVSTWQRYGLSPNIEIYFNLLTISALYVLLKRNHYLNSLGAGLLMGLGFIIKYVVLFDFAAILVFMIITAARHIPRSRLRYVITSTCLSVIAFLLPFLSINLYYYLHGQFSDFAQIAYCAVARYPKQLVAADMAPFVLDFLVSFLPIHLVFLYSLSRKTERATNSYDLRLLSMTWIPFVLTGILLPGHPLRHFFIQLMLPVSLQANVFFLPDLKMPILLRRMTSGTIGLTLLVSLISGDVWLSYRNYYGRYDAPVRIADYLRPRLKPEDVIFAGNCYQVLYYLLEKDSPTPFVHSSLLNSSDHRETLGIDLGNEMQRLAGKRPAFIVIQTEGRFRIDWIHSFLNEYYVVEQSFGNRTVLYSRKDRSVDRDHGARP